MAMKKGPTKGSGGKHRNALRGKGPTPKAEDRVYHKAYRAKKTADRRRVADPRIAARRRVAKYTSDSDDLVIGRNAVLEALRVGVPSSQLYIASRIEHDDRTRDIVRLAGMQGLNLLEADRLEMDRIARSGNHQGVILKAQPYQYSSLQELAERAEKRAKAMQAADSGEARIASRPLFIALDGVTDPQNLGAVIRSAAAFGANGVILPERRSASVTAAAWKVSAGAAAHIPVARVVNLTKALEALKERGYYTVGLDGGGERLVGETGFESDPLVVVLGSEGKGLSRLVREACDAIAGIPITNVVESLNASVAAGISLYAVARARREAASATADATRAQ
ncbi:23S rRNA (guanosine(2251)-2'-O)-methyltransferase RlmB [Bifidobacterium sp.]|uniref:23S rRNA (guanosine(2251)-2'-O)-methyltransferase RlmB n=1 Tax=Bifidobacterium sp. TaxID=41200 RepID=UPI0025C0DDBC|nr:23S rRNA (guanosine(2251)-2'-O)-methyltransferase RlmB [Bifidobacterium sp.]MCH4209505.1 23S rRNA (guanosine(2251)-2'-O)-methyltransferase RlmB [Bifidobacterium sp.]MCI1224789.1 23S rRNA (guanosine(2251)-2'-O)-methyltransferase RlmB [Bifidobacterium sp.]